VVLIAGVAGILLSIPVTDTSEDPSVPLLTVFSAVFLLAFIVIIALGTASRIAMKNKFNIGSRSSCGPSAAWLFCAPCALCQETRTLRMNNVDQGIWAGGDPIVTWKYRIPFLLPHTETP